MSDFPDDNIPENGSTRRLRRDADKGREPQLIPGQLGQRWISMNALVEQIESAFVEEHGDDSPELLEANTPSKRLKLVLAVTDYVLSVESAQVSNQEKADIINRVYSNLFGYGPLDALFLDGRVTTISLDGVDKAAVRYSHGELTSLGPIFQNDEHLRRVLKRLLIDAGADLQEDQPYIEVGLMAGERPVCLNLVAPPVAFQFTADIRVHPAQLPTWDDLLALNFLTSQAVELLKALASSSYGLMIVGESESGKTTILSLLVQSVPNPERMVSVERAGELRLPPGAERLSVKWPVGDQPGISFGDLIAQALAKNPATLLLDEVRSDEPQTIAPLLELSNAPRQIWSFRGAIFTKRLGSALGMLARRADVGGGEDRVRALYERLPYVIAVNRSNNALRLWSIGEWQFKHSPDYPTYTPLLQIEEGQLKLTGERPERVLDLPDSFWTF
jgi:Flp pilus assembly CpaF family ATPase